MSCQEDGLTAFTVTEMTPEIVDFTAGVYHGVNPDSDSKPRLQSALTSRDGCNEKSDQGT